MSLGFEVNRIFLDYVTLVETLKIFTFHKYILVGIIRIFFPKKIEYLEVRNSVKVILKPI